MKKLEQADARPKHGSNYHRHLKVKKRRLERHRANQDPETQPLYRRYAGYET